MSDKWFQSSFEWAETEPDGKSIEGRKKFHSAGFFLRIRRYIKHVHVNLIFIAHHCMMKMARFFVATYKVLIGSINSSTKNPLSSYSNGNIIIFIFGTCTKPFYILSLVFMSTQHMNIRITGVAYSRFYTETSNRNCFSGALSPSRNHRKYCAYGTWALLSLSSLSLSGHSE